MSREYGKEIDEFLADVSNIKLTRKLREGRSAAWLTGWGSLLWASNSPPRSRFFNTLVFRRS